MTSDRYLVNACVRRAGAVLDHMSTATVARDMDRLRRAVGDHEFSLYGASYGSLIGQTHANVFPDNFRALVIDGVPDPIAWTTGVVASGVPPGTERDQDLAPWVDFGAS